MAPRGMGPSIPCTVVPKGDRDDDAAQPRPLDCRELAENEAPTDPPPDGPPLTEGREFAGAAPWNLWANANYVGIADRRYGLDLDSSIGSLSIGADRRFNDKLVAGFTLGIQNSWNSAFENDWRLDTNGVNLGIYAAYLVSRNWVLDASFNYSRIENTQRIVVLNGDSSSNVYSSTVDATGQYPLGSEAFIRPKLSVTYGHNQTGGYAMQGTLLNTPLQFNLPGVSYNFGTIESSAEVNRTFRTKGGALIMPFSEIAVRYDFARPNDGRIITGDLTSVRVSPWAGSIRLGVRSLISRATMFEARLGYLSVGQRDLNVWEARLMLSHYF